MAESLYLFPLDFMESWEGVTKISEESVMTLF